MRQPSTKRSGEGADREVSARADEIGCDRHGLHGPCWKDYKVLWEAKLHWRCGARVFIRDYRGTNDLAQIHQCVFLQVGGNNVLIYWCGSDGGVGSTDSRG